MSDKMNSDFYADFVQVLPECTGQVVITGVGHAHRGCQGEVESGPERLAGVDTPMYRVRLTSCPHKIEACFAVREDLTPRRSPDLKKAVSSVQNPMPGPAGVPVDTALERWLVECREIRARTDTDRFQANDLGLLPTRSDFFKVVELQNRRAVSAFAFVARWDGENKTVGRFWTGHIYTPNTWQRPARHSRGTVWESAAQALSEHGYGVRKLR